MEASKSFELPDEQEEKRPVSPEAVAKRLGTVTAVAEHLSDEGDGGGHDPDHHTHNSDYQDSFVA